MLFLDEKHTYVVWRDPNRKFKPIKEILLRELFKVCERMELMPGIVPARRAGTVQHATIKAEQLWTDNNVLAIASAGTSTTIIVGPQGTTTGKPKYTFTSCIIEQLDLKWENKSAVSENFSAKGILTGIGTF